MVFKDIFARKKRSRDKRELVQKTLIKITATFIYKEHGNYEVKYKYSYLEIVQMIVAKHLTFSYYNFQPFRCTSKTKRIILNNSVALYLYKVR